MRSTTRQAAQLTSRISVASVAVAGGAGTVGRLAHLEAGVDQEDHDSQADEGANAT